MAAVPKPDADVLMQRARVACLDLEPTDIHVVITYMLHIAYFRRHSERFKGGLEP